MAPVFYSSGIKLHFLKIQDFFNEKSDQLLHIQWLALDNHQSICDKLPFRTSKRFLSRKSLNSMILNSEPNKNKRY
ncbi:hypothetical protein ASE55_11975 [Chryseobacterium sp. Leaf201]|nr:hypothetical protein ASE55_11975 [Chryseobacterium sp. Leaf201]